MDTCCIDKSSSAELSEAINSMFRWYCRATLCYVYLIDVGKGEGGDGFVPAGLFHESRWFTRGWTLQELIAPVKLFFYTRDWKFVASRDRLYPSQLEPVIKVTGLPRSVIKRNRNGERAVCPETRSGPRALPHDFDSQTCRRCGSREDWLDVLNSISIAERLSWAAKRETTRPEDKAYCLLGLFGVNMPLLYGEGSSAFPRLLEEVLKTSDDQSVFAFARSVFLSHPPPLR